MGWRTILDRLFEDSQNSQRSHDCATTQCDTTQIDEEDELLGDAQRSPEAETVSPATTDEDVTTTASEDDEEEEEEIRKNDAEWPHACPDVPSTGIKYTPGPPATEEVEAVLRKKVGLLAAQATHPASPRNFSRQAEAVAYLQALLAKGEYQGCQLGLFSREFTSTGSRQFLVDTHAGFALSSAPRKAAALQQRHLYEVIMDETPCWLYFDLEYARCANPDLQPKRVMEAFYDLLGQFCSAKLGLPLDMSSVYDLDSTTLEKFSKHVVVKGLQGPGQSSQLAFRNNAQVGYVVKEFMKYTNEQRQNKNPLAGLLFARRKPKNGAGGTNANSAPSADEASVVDEAVYTRNRCFRVLFSSKFGKRRPLVPTWAASRDSEDGLELPHLQLLNSLVTFVPEGTSLFKHTFIPEDLKHGGLKAGRAIRKEGRADDVPPEWEASTDSRGLLMDYLVTFWDRARSDHTEPGGIAGRATRVQRTFLMRSGHFLVVSLANNNFCFHKGACHKSNGIYLVVDHHHGVFYQKCHDVADCPNFRSQEFELPKELVPSPGKAERADAEGNADLPRQGAQELMATPPSKLRELLDEPTPPSNTKGVEASHKRPEHPRPRCNRKVYEPPVASSEKKDDFELLLGESCAAPCKRARQLGRSTSAEGTSEPLHRSVGSFLLDLQDDP